jgi:hypothetical protein
MAINGEEPIGSMGTDTSLAVLSDKPRLLYDYFQQLFAQVTNPPLDAIREELVTSMGSTIGPERNLLKPEPESCRQIFIKYPIIHNEHVAKLRHLPPDSPFRSTTLSMVFDPQKGGAGLDAAMTELCRRASEAVAADTTSSSCPIAASARSWRPSRACWPRPACTITWCAKARARAAAWSSNRATRVRCITSRCCSAMAQVR